MKIHEAGGPGNTHAAIVPEECEGCIPATRICKRLTPYTGLLSRRVGTLNAVPPFYFCGRYVGLSVHLFRKCNISHVAGLILTKTWRETAFCPRVAAANTPINFIGPTVRTA